MLDTSPPQNLLQKTKAKTQAMIKTRRATKQKRERLEEQAEKGVKLLTSIPTTIRSGWRLSLSKSRPSWGCAQTPDVSGRASIRAAAAPPVAFAVAVECRRRCGTLPRRFVHAKEECRGGRSGGRAGSAAKTPIIGQQRRRQRPIYGSESHRAAASYCDGGGAITLSLSIQGNFPDPGMDGGSSDQPRRRSLRQR